MRSRKGFSTIELLAVIIILAIILIIAAVAVLGYINNSRERTHDQLMLIIGDAAQAWVLDVHGGCPGEQQPPCNVEVKLEEICEHGLLECPLVNPLSGNVLSGETSVTITINAQGAMTMGRFNAVDEGDEGIDIDLAAGPTITLSHPNWTNQNVTMTLAHSGNATRMEFSVNGGSWSRYTSPVIFRDPGITAVRARAFFEDGSRSNETRREVRIDRTTPTCGTIVASGTQGTNGWFRGNITLTATGGSAGPAGFQSNTVTPSVITTNTLLAGTNATVTCRDNAGNTATGETRNFRRDNIAPTCTTTGGNDAWVNTSRTITSTCSDAHSGCVIPSRSHTYSVDTNTTLAGAAGTNITNTFFDNAGNESARCPTNQVVRVGRTRPFAPFVSANAFAIGTGCTVISNTCTTTHHGSTNHTANRTCRIEIRIPANATCSGQFPSLSGFTAFAPFLRWNTTSFGFGANNTCAFDVACGHELSMTDVAGNTGPVFRRELVFRR